MLSASIVTLISFNFACLITIFACFVISFLILLCEIKIGLILNLFLSIYACKGQLGKTFIVFLRILLSCFPLKWFYNVGTIISTKATSDFLSV